MECVELCFGVGDQPRIWGSGLAGRPAKWEFLHQTVSSGMRQVRPPPANKREPQFTGTRVTPNEERYQAQNLLAGQCSNPGDSWGTRITTPVTQAAEEQSMRHPVGPEPYKHRRTL